MSELENDLGERHSKSEDETNGDNEEDKSPSLTLSKYRTRKPVPPPPSCRAYLPFQRPYHNMASSVSKSNAVFNLSVSTTGAHREGNSQQDLVLRIFVLSANYLALSRLTHAPFPRTLAPHARAFPTHSRASHARLSRASMLYEMPFRGTDCAPKFDGTTDNLAEFIDAYEQLADEAGLQGRDRIKGIIRYLERDDRELWAGLPEAQESDYDVFMKEIKVMYPGWDGKRRYAPVDLQALAHEYAQKPMFSGQELSAYLRAFRKIMQPLLNEDRIGKAERDRIFMEGIPSEVQAPICMRLMIKHPDHYPQDPYPFMQVYAAGQFILPANAPPPTTAPSAQNTIPTLSATVPSACAPSAHTPSTRAPSAHTPSTHAPSTCAPSTRAPSMYTPTPMQGTDHYHASRADLHQTGLVHG
ncbi:hypothetical protein BD769DRAFT_1683948 [Suillus cothurnatus]|nr:hypothetical protein BD769DRAFT_1683948 [Suillus cothurnatus]